MAENAFKITSQALQNYKFPALKKQIFGYQNAAVHGFRTFAPVQVRCVRGIYFPQV